MTTILTQKCECEHESHFCFAHTPNNNPAHKYGVHFAKNYMVRKITPYGIFTVCSDCANDCYAQYGTERHLNKEEIIEKYGDKRDI
jgi:hypothetical protein